MGHLTINYNLASLLVAFASLVVALTACFIARSSLIETRRVAERDLRYWRQRTWIDVYYKADEVYDALEEFQVKYCQAGPQSIAFWSVQLQEDANRLRAMTRRVHSMAAVFPQNPVMDKLFANTDFKDTQELLSKTCLDALFEAVQDIRDKALIKESSILG